jgi:hypothetical protein
MCVHGILQPWQHATDLLSNMFRPKSFEMSRELAPRHLMAKIWKYRERDCLHHLCDGTSSIFVLEMAGRFHPPIRTLSVENFHSEFKFLSVRQQISYLVSRSTRQFGGKKFKIEIDSSIWREEIQNRNRLLDLAGRNSK